MLDELTSHQRQILARVRRRLVPFVFICYVVAYIDRVNIGFAATELQRSLGLSPTAYGFGAGLFFLAYCAFEIPSNLILERVGARRWIARILVSWGVVSMGTMFITDTWTFMLSRVLLGFAEAGFFPGVILYLTYWIPAAERARTGALFMMAGPIAVIVGAPLSEALLTLEGVLGLHGWQWMFLVEGFPAVVLGLLALNVLTDRPALATWLEPEDRGWLSGVMATERAERQRVGHTHLRGAFGSARVWLLSSILFMHTMVTYGLFLWLPKLLRDASGLEGFALSSVTSFPFLVALAAMVAIGRHSDRTGERKRHVAACAITGAVGLLLAVASEGRLWLLVLSFTLAQMANRGFTGVFWALPPMFLAGSAAAGGIALINAVGNLGGFAGPAMMGALRDLTGGYNGGLLVLAAALLAQALLVLALKLPPRAGHDESPTAVRPEVSA